MSLDKHSAAANAALTSSMHDPRRDSSAASPPTGNHSETGDELGDLEHVSSQFARGGGGSGSGGRDSPKCHSRSSSHDSYFEQRKLSVQFKLDLDDEDGECEEEEEGLSPRNVSSLDISEIAVNFDLEDNEMKIFSEDEAMVSTSVGSELSLPRSPLEETTAAMSAKIVNSSAKSTASSRPVAMRKATTTDSSPFVRGTTTTRQTSENPPANKDDLSPTKTRRMSFKDKLRKFTSPTLPRKQNNNNNNSGDVPSRLMTDSGLGGMEGTGEGSSCSPLASLENRGDDSAKSLKVRHSHKSIKNIYKLFTMQN